LSFVPGFRSSCLADLFWSLTSPDLCFPAEPPGLDVQVASSFLADKESQLLDELSARKGHLVGTYFEFLWGFFLEHSPSTRLIAKNLQVFRDAYSGAHSGKGKTLGEFDFIYYCLRRDEYVHLEVAVKFYLGLPGIAGGKGCWVGPGGRDDLETKFLSMQNRQTCLSGTHEGRAALKQLGVDSVKREGVIKGILFHPTPDAGSVHLPDYVEPDYQQGLWCSVNDSGLDIIIESFRDWRVLGKPFWLDVDPDDCRHKPFSDGEPVGCQIRDMVETLSAPVQFCGFDDAGVPNRLFVTPGDWQQRMIEGIEAGPDLE
jgi:hypothetical protein